MEGAYKKTLADEIDWKIIDQLHSAVASFSSASLEVKKVFFALVTGLIAVALRITSLPLNWKLFAAAYIIIFLFWYLDGFTYYYQEKLRERIDERFNSIKQRHSLNDFDNIDQLTLEDNRTQGSRIKRSALNSAVWIYPICLLINTISLAIHLT